MQLKQIGLGASAGNSSFLKLEYDYGTTDNNGNLREQKITIPGMSAQLIQGYAYDGLNRLQSSTETKSGVIQWKQSFVYDRFGNRRFDPNNTTTLPQNNGVYNPNIDPQTNKFLVAEGYNYDHEGNLTSNPESQLFTYDAENRQTQVQNTSSQTIANYYYDGNGSRVRKVVGNKETIFVYDAFGKLVAEYTTNLAITNDGTKYLTADALGSPRAITDIGGTVLSRHDYMPFGEEVLAGTGGRTVAQGYLQTSDGVRQQFTGHEKDFESGLDYAQARYYSGKHGRFTSVDPLSASANIKNPQTFNRYSYGLNSPYKFTDPLGLQPKCQGPGGGQTSSCDGNDKNGAPLRPDCPPDTKCDKEGRPIIPETIVDVQIDSEGVSIAVGSYEITHEFAKEKSWWRRFKDDVKGFFGFDTGTGAPPTTIPIPTDTGTDPSSGSPDAPSGGSGDSAEAVALRVALLIIQFKVREFIEGKKNPCPCLIRHGTDDEKKLREDAEEAKLSGFPYGVSTKRVEKLSGSDKRSRWAPLKAAQTAFPGTSQTGQRKNHYTVVFSSPVNQELTKAFNSIFTFR